MSKFLNPYSEYARLMEEYREHGCLYIAYDFDDTVCPYIYKPTAERPENKSICELLRNLRPYAKFILWTNRSDGYEWNGETEQLTAAKRWLDDHNVPYDYVNENPEVSFGSPKVYANIFIDDRAGLQTAVAVLNEFLRDVKDLPTFKPMVARRAIVESIREYFAENGPEAKAIIGVSGGVDSTVVAALCAEALGPDRVLAFLMPNGHQNDYDDALEVCRRLNINFKKKDIEGIVDAMAVDFGYLDIADEPLLKNNLPCLVRRLYLSVAGMVDNGRVMNTTNRTEDFLGYITKGDNTAGDFAPIINYLKTEVVAIGKTYKSLSTRLVEKAPSDGMCGVADEDRFGFTYEQVDQFINDGERFIPGVSKFSLDVTKAIRSMHKNSMFKRIPLPRTPYVGGPDRE